MVRQHHQLNGHESEQALGDGEGQRSLACCSSWSRRVGHDVATEQQQQNKLLRVKNRLPINPTAFQHTSQSCRGQKFQHTCLDELSGFSSIAPVNLVQSVGPGWAPSFLEAADTALPGPPHPPLHPPRKRKATFSVFIHPAAAHIEDFKKWQMAVLSKATLHYQTME